MSNDKSKGEGNRVADQHYREGVRETVKNTTEEERERLAGKDLSTEEREELRDAEDKGKSRARH